MGKNIFIVVDGIDGSGKSEIVKMLHNYLFSKNKKYRILTTREPTNGPYGNKIRQMLANEKNPLKSKEKLLDLFIKDREYHLKNTIEPFLKNFTGDEINIVLCDRYYYSTIAFQSAQGLNMQDIIAKNRKFRKPDVTFILDVEPKLALKRIKHRKKEKFEKLEFMKKIRKNFLMMPRLVKDNIKIIDSNKTPDKVFDSIKKEVDKVLI